jgi:hypothetical protein
VRELVNLRGETHEVGSADYQVLEAPFFYLRGYMLVAASYKDWKAGKADGFGLVPLLDSDDSSGSNDDSSSSEEEEAEETEGNAEDNDAESEENESEADANENALPEVAQEGESMVAQSEEDPEINEGLEEESVPLENGEDQQEQTEGGDENRPDDDRDAFACLRAASEAASRFANSRLVSADEQETRWAVLSNLVLDALKTIDQFRKAQTCCSDYLGGREKIMSVTLLEIGRCFRELKMYSEAAQAFEDSATLQIDKQLE